MQTLPLNQNCIDYRLLFEGLIEQSIAGIYLLQDARLIYVNDAFARLCGVSKEKLAGRMLAQVAPPAQREALLAQYTRRLAGSDKDSTFTVRLQLPNGQERALEIHGRSIDFNGQPAVIGVGIDATVRLQRQAELQASKMALAELIGHIEVVRETERQRIAMELHDAVGGALSALKFDIARLQRQIGKAIPGQSPMYTALDQSVRDCAALVQETIAIVRQISEDLHPGALPHLGLSMAIENHLKQFAARYGLRTHYTPQTDDLGLGPDAMVHLYRIFQESLTNVAKHAHARAVWVALNRTDNEILLSIQDDGIGILDPSQKPGTYGLLGMRERARQLGGALSFAPIPSGGTRLSVRLPAPKPHT